MLPIDQLKDLILEHIQHCADADLLDLIYKLLAAES